MPVQAGSLQAGSMEIPVWTPVAAQLLPRELVLPDQKRAPAQAGALALARALLQARAKAGAMEMLAVPTAEEEMLVVGMKMAAWTAAVEKLLGEMVPAQKGWRYER
jgi:hypothetical protein